LAVEAPKVTQILLSEP